MRSPSDLALRAVRTGIDFLLDHWQSGDDVSEGRLRQEVAGAFDAEVAAAASDPVDAHRRRILVDRAVTQAAAIRRAPTLGALLDRRGIAEWMRLDRLQPLHIGGIRAYSAPDLLVRRGEGWILVRLAMRGARRPTEVGRIEMHAMVVWAKRQFGLPEDADRFSVERISWLGHRWLRWHERSSISRAEEARRLLAHDGQAFADLRSVGPKHGEGMASLEETLSPFDRTLDRRHCRRCGYRSDCPGSDTSRARSEVVSSSLRIRRPSARDRRKRTPLPVEATA